MKNFNEETEQKNLFTWAKLVKNTYPGIDLMFAIPNGAFLHGTAVDRAKQWKRLEKAGAKKGVSDIFLPVPVGEYCGLWIEMKATKDKRPVISKEQKKWIEAMELQGYAAVIAYGFDDAVALIDKYYHCA